MTTTAHSAKVLLGTTTPKGGAMKKIKEVIRKRNAQKGLMLPERYRNVRDLRWTDDLEREITELRWRM